jgi:hypothetical protein
MLKSLTPALSLKERVERQKTVAGHAERQKIT